MWLPRPTENIDGLVLTPTFRVPPHPSVNMGVCPLNAGTNVVWVDFAKSKLTPAEDVVERYWNVAKQPLRDELQAARALEGGWDGPDSHPPSAAAIDAALEFLATIPPVKLPELAIASDGEISINWRGDDYAFDMSFAASGGRAFFARHGERRVKMAQAPVEFATLPLVSLLIAQTS